MLKDQLPRRLLVALGHSLVAPAVWACRVIEQAGTKWNLIESRKCVGGPASQQRPLLGRVVESHGGPLGLKRLSSCVVWGRVDVEMGFSVAHNVPPRKQFALQQPFHHKTNKATCWRGLQFIHFPSTQ